MFKHLFSKMSLQTAFIFLHFLRDFEEQYKKSTHYYQSIINELIVLAVLSCCKEKCNWLVCRMELSIPFLCVCLFFLSHYFIEEDKRVEKEKCQRQMKAKGVRQQGQKEMLLDKGTCTKSQTHIVHKILGQWGWKGSTQPPIHCETVSNALHV